MILQQQKTIWQQRRYVVGVKETGGRDGNQVQGKFPQET